MVALRKLPPASHLPYLCFRISIFSSALLFFSFLPSGLGTGGGGAHAPAVAQLWVEQGKA